MGKTSRKKHQHRLQKATLQKYGQVKLSDAIAHISEPFDSDELDFNGYNNLITCAVTAWNIALSSNLEDRKEKLLSALAALPDFTQNFKRDFMAFSTSPFPGQEPPDSMVMLHILAELMKRKDDLYPNDDRYIVDFALTPTVKGYHLQIKSLIPKRSDD